MHIIKLTPLLMVLEACDTSPQSDDIISDGTPVLSIDILSGVDGIEADAMRRDHPLK